jgi:hypothetical protein
MLQVYLSGTVVGQQGAEAQPERLGVLVSRVF